MVKGVRTTQMQHQNVLRKTADTISLSSLRSSPEGCPGWSSCPCWWPCWWSSGWRPNGVVVATGSSDWWWQACLAWSPSPSPSAVEAPHYGADLRIVNIHIFALFIVYKGGTVDSEEWVGFATNKQKQTVVSYTGKEFTKEGLQVCTRMHPSSPQ